MLIKNIPPTPQKSEVVAALKHSEESIKTEVLKITLFFSYSKKKNNFFTKNTCFLIHNHV